MDTTTQQESSPRRMIWQLAWPQTLMMLCHFFIGFVDVYVAGQINEEVQASLGVITQTLFFFLIVAMALANGAVSAISQSLGAGKTARARRYVGLCLGLILLAGLGLSGVGFAIRQHLLNLLQVPADIRPLTDYFLEVYLLLLPFYYLFIVSNAVFRSQKRVFIPLFSMFLATAANTLGDFGLCFGLWGLPEIGFKGLPWATVLSISCGLAFNLLMLGRSGWLKPGAFPPLRWIRRGLPYLWSVAWPAGLMQILWHTAYLVIFAITASLPRGNVTALAALAAGIRLESILFLPAVAFNMTASILVGHALGQGDTVGAKRLGLKIWASGITLISGLGALLWLAAPQLSVLLSDKTAVSDEIVNYLHFNIAAIPFTGTGLILGGVFIGAGATRYNMLAIGVTIWLIRLPLAFILGHHVLGTATGIWAAMLVSQFMQACLMLLLFSLKDWSKYSMLARKNRKKHSGVAHAPQFPTPVAGKSSQL